MRSPEKKPGTPSPDAPTNFAVAKEALLDAYTAGYGYSSSLYFEAFQDAVEAAQNAEEINFLLGELDKFKADTGIDEVSVEEVTLNEKLAALSPEPTTPSDSLRSEDRRRMDPTATSGWRGAGSGNPTWSPENPTPDPEDTPEDTPEDKPEDKPTLKEKALEELKKDIAAWQERLKTAREDIQEKFAARMEADAALSAAMLTGDQTAIDAAKAAYDATREAYNEALTTYTDIRKEGEEFAKRREEIESMEDSETPTDETPDDNLAPPIETPESTTSRLEATKSLLRSKRNAFIEAYRAEQKTLRLRSGVSLKKIAGWFIGADKKGSEHSAEFIAARSEYLRTKSEQASMLFALGVPQKSIMETVVFDEVDALHNADIENMNVERKNVLYRFNDFLESPKVKSYMKRYGMTAAIGLSAGAVATGGVAAMIPMIAGIGTAAGIGTMFEGIKYKDKSIFGGIKGMAQKYIDVEGFKQSKENISEAALDTFGSKLASIEKSYLEKKRTSANTERNLNITKRASQMIGARFAAGYAADLNPEPNVNPIGGDDIENEPFIPTEPSWTPIDLDVSEIEGDPGWIKMFSALQENIEANGNELPEYMRGADGTPLSGEQMAMKFGFYDPSQVNESMNLFKGDSLVLDSSGNLHVQSAHTGTNATLTGPGGSVTPVPNNFHNWLDTNPAPAPVAVPEPYSRPTITDPTLPAGVDAPGYAPDPTLPAGVDAPGYAPDPTTLEASPMDELERMRAELDALLGGGDVAPGGDPTPTGSTDPASAPAGTTVGGTIDTGAIGTPADDTDVIVGGPIETKTTDGPFDDLYYDPDDAVVDTGPTPEEAARETAREAEQQHRKIEKQETRARIATNFGRFGGNLLNALFYSGNQQPPYVQGDMYASSWSVLNGAYPQGNSYWFSKNY